VLLVGKFTGRALGFVLQILLARLLGPATLGVYALGSKSLQLTGALATLGLDQGVVRFGSAAWLHQPEKLRGLVLQALAFTALSGGLGAAALIAASPWLSTQVFASPELAEVLPIFGAGALLLALLRVAAAATRTTQNMRYSMLVEDLFPPLTLLILLVTLYLAGWRLVGAAVATVGSLLPAVLAALYFLHRLTGLFSLGAARVFEPSRRLLSFSLPTALAGTLSMLVLSVDLLLVGFFLPEAETGIYQAASQVPLILVLVLNAFNNVLSPMISDLYHRHETDQLNEIFKLGTKWGLYLSLPVFLLVALDSENVMTALFGGDFRQGALPMVLLCAGQMANLATGAVGFMLIMSDRQHAWLVASGGALILNIALGVALIPRLGLVGAAIAAATALAALFATGLVMVRRGLGLWPYDRRLAKLIPASLASALAVYLLGRVGLDPGALRLALTATASLGAFAGVLLLLGLDPEDHDLLRSILRRGSRSAGEAAR
jgi:O-antigen/teichoic acid export membrane protein